MHSSDSTPDLVAALRVADGAQWVYLWRRLQQRDDAGPHLAETIRHDVRRRRTALSTLTRAGLPEVVEALLMALDDERRPVRRLAIMRLGDSGAEAAVPALLNELRSDEPADLRSEAVRALAKIGSSAATDAVAAAADDPDPAVREAAAAALAETRPAARSAMPGLTLPGSWYTDPLIHAESQIYTFRPDGTGEAEDITMGLVNERMPFTYRADGDRLEFRFGADPEPRRTRFRIRPGIFRHPYEGATRCAILEFAGEPHFTGANAPYYRLPEDR